MSGPELDMEYLLRPVGRADFFSKYWEREPLLLRRNAPSFYDSLVKLGDIEGFIARGDARYPAIRLAKAGGFYPPEAYTVDFKFGDESFRGMPDVEKIHAEYSAGATITLPAWHRAWPPLGSLCARMEAEVDHVVSANVYLTPANVAGFTPHYDTHEVLVLQIAGSKQWRVYPPPVHLPHRSQVFCADRYELPAAPSMTIELEPGDLLYLPRGFVHTTSTTTHASAHITLAITVYSWVEMLMELTQHMTDDPEFKRGLPPGFASRGDAAADLAHRFAQLLPRLAQQVDLQTVSERFLKRVAKVRPRPATPFISHTDFVTPNTRLRVATGASYTFATEADKYVLVLNGRRINLQLAAAPVMQAMCSVAKFTTAELPVNVPLEARISLVRFLYGIGFLVTESD